MGHNAEGTKEAMKRTVKNQIVAKAAHDFQGLLAQSIDEIVDDMEKTLRKRELASESGLSGFSYKVSCPLTINPGTDSAEIKVEVVWGGKQRVCGDTRTCDDQVEFDYDGDPDDQGVEPETEPETAEATA